MGFTCVQLYAEGDQIENHRSMGYMSRGYASRGYRSRGNIGQAQYVRSHRPGAVHGVGYRSRGYTGHGLYVRGYR